MSAASALHELGLDSKSIAAIKRKAKGHGKTTPQFVRELIEEGLRATQTFDEILAPVREDFRRSGMTMDEFDALITRARKAAAPRKRRKSTRGATR